MKNLYNKGTFRSFEYGKIGPYLKKHGNTKWRRTEKSEIENQLSETIKIFMHIRYHSYRCNVSNNEPFEELVAEISTI